MLSIYSTAGTSAGTGLQTKAKVWLDWTAYASESTSKSWRSSERATPRVLPFRGHGEGRLNPLARFE